MGGKCTTKWYYNYKGNLALNMEKVMYRFFGSLLIFAFSSNALAIDIGAMTIAMAPKEDFIVRTITNNSNVTKVYEVQMEKINNPTTKGVKLPTIPGELLFSPKRFMLHANNAQNIKLYYKGPADNNERYYRITFTESPVAQVDKNMRNSLKGALEIKLAVQSILVVRPRQIAFDYLFDENQQTITNSGNTYFEFMVKQGCEQPDSEATSKYLLPGERWQNNNIGKAGNQHVIIYKNKFIPVGKECQ